MDEKGCARSEIFTALYLRVQVFLDVTLCHWVSGFESVGRL